MRRNRMRSSTTSTRRSTPSAPSDAHLNQLTTEVLRLRCDQLKLPASGSRLTLIARLRAAPRPAETENPATEQAEASAATNTVVENQPSTSGGFTPEQFETLQSLISSSLRDVLAQQSTAAPLAESDMPDINTMATSSPSPFPNTVTASFPPHLPPKTISSIRNGEYVDFNSLLPENVDGHDEQLRISFDSLGGPGFSIPVSLSQQKRQRIDSIERWLNAFNNFASVVVHFSPYKASELFAYQQNIRDAQRKFAGMAWYAYDIAFRKKAATDRSLSWANRDPQLYLEKFTGLAKTACHVCGSADHFVNSCPIAPNRTTPRPTDDQCRNYNRKVPCMHNPCPYKHRCNRPGCIGHHPAVEHDARAAESSNSKRGR